MKPVIPPLALSLCAAALGIALQADPFVTSADGLPTDQEALGHRDSPYAHVSWVISEGSNFAQLRFFDKVEGGVCLRPGWQELQQLAHNDQRLAHLVPGTDWTWQPTPGKTWPKDRPHPDLGTLTNTKYICGYPAAILLNDRLMANAAGDARQAAARILIVGLGSGIGVAMYAHHFPEAAITVVDIDHVVEDMVIDHYPFLRWLTTQTTSAGLPRLHLAVGDARQYVRYSDMRPARENEFDVVVLDAYTSGSTIPPHLMTREFYGEIKNLLTPDGIVLSNIIGSYTGEKNLLLGGAVRSMLEAGFTSVHNLPVIDGIHDQPPLDVSRARNNIVLASQAPLDPRSHRSAWERLRSFEPYPELAVNRYVTTDVMLLDPGLRVSATVHLSDSALEAEVENLARTQREKITQDQLRALRSQNLEPFAQRDDDQIRGYVENRDLQERVRQAVRAQHNGKLPRGWDMNGPKVVLTWTRIDWVLHARRTWQRMLTVADDTRAGAYVHDGKTLIGETIMGTPLFTDAKPNADIYNR